MLKKIIYKTAKRSIFVWWWSLVAAVVLMHFCYYGVFPNNNT
tara:strand:- start:56 stop:181 length:126 start_codon:yes stop_codon:yes gene_type:complete